jgi:hypothetical protein
MEKNPIVEHIKTRVLRKNKNFLCVVTGETGGGKSFCAMRICQLVDSGFNIKKIVFTPKEFLVLINSKELKRGDCIIFDEAGTGMSSREWYTVQNILINKLLQTFRHKNLVVFFCVPSIEYIDNQTRGLFHAYLETLRRSRADEKEKVVPCKFMFMQHNPRTGKTYFKYPRCKTKDKRVTIIEQLTVCKPSKELIREYEPKKARFTKSLNIEIETTLDSVTRNKKMGRPKDISGITDEIHRDLDEFIVVNKGYKYLNKSLIMGRFDVGAPTAGKVKAMIESEINK